MKKYQWDIYKIRDNIKILTDSLNDVQDTDTRQLITETIEQYEMMLNFVSKGKIQTTSNNVDIYDTSTLTLDDAIDSYMEYLNTHDEAIVQSILDTYPLIKDFKINDDNYLVSFTNEKIMEITEDCINTLPPFIRKRYEKEINNNPSFLHIHYYPNNDSGETLIDPVLKQKYILINRNNSPIDLTTPLHEIFHFIFNDYNSFLISSNQVYYTQEIEGSLANLIISDYIRKNNSNVSRQIDEDFLIYYKMRTISFVVLQSYLQSLKNDKLSMHKMEKFLNYFEVFKKFDKEEIIKLLNCESADLSLAYNLSFLASLDLYKIYERDPEFAFYLLKNIRFQKSDDNVFSLLRRNHITFMDDNYENFKKYIKKVESL